MAATNECITLEIPCHAKYIALVRLAVAGVAARTQLTVDDIDDVKVAVSEACTNVIEHAFTAEETIDRPRAIEIRFYPQDKQLRVEVTDQGKGFDPKRVISPEGNLQDKEGGLGLYLIERLMDDVDIQSAPGSGTKVTMVKYASG